jgi:hypothetical protein
MALQCKFFQSIAQPGFAYSVTALGPLAASNSSWWLTRIDDQTTKLEVVLSYDIRFGLFGRILHKLVMRKKLQQSLPKTVAATKKHVEGTYTPASLVVCLSEIVVYMSYRTLHVRVRVTSWK